MRRLYGDWRDIHHAAPLAFSVRKMYSAFLGVLASAIGLAIINTVRIARSGLDDLAGENVVEVIQELRIIDFIALNKYFYATTLNSGIGVQAIYIAPAFAWLWFVWSHFGGIITREAALELAGKNSAVSSKRYVLSRFRSYFWSGMALETTILAFGLLIAGALALTRLPGAGSFAWVLIGIFSPVLLAAALFAAFLTIVGGFGSIFFMPAISTEGSDAFDATARGITYFLQAPARYFLYLVINALYAVLAGALVLGGVVLAYKLVLGGFAAGLAGETGVEFGAYWDYFLKAAFTGSAAGPEPVVSSVPARIAAYFAIGWSASMFIFFAGYLVSFFFTGSTISYLLMRRAVEGTPMDKVRSDTGGALVGE